MPGFEDFLQTLDQIEAAVLEELPNIATVMALAAKAIAERNIKDQGVGKTYSVNPIPVYWFEGKELNGKGTQYIETKQGKRKKKGKKKTDDEDFNGISEKDLDATGTWGEFRQAQGLQAAFVDLTYSGEMFRGTVPGDPDFKERYVVFVYLAGTNAAVVDKLNWNAERYGDFISKAIKPEDRNTLDEVAGDSFNDVIKRFL